MEKDEREETGLRAVLNYGHTFAHAFETVGGYGGWLHGEAVAAGMVCACSARRETRAHRHGISPIGRCDLLAAFGLPIAPEREWPIDEQIAVMRRDKKANGGAAALHPADSTR